MNEFAGQFWLWCALLTALAAGFIVSPLWRMRRATESKGESASDRANIALFRARKLELEAELAAGELERESFDALLLDLQKSLLLDIGESPAAGSGNQTSRRGLTLAAPLLAMLLLPAATWWMYSQWGQLADVELMEQFQRTVANEGDAESAGELVLSLGRVVQENPERPWAWYFLGENLSTLGIFDAANSAYLQAAERLSGDEEKAAALGRAVLTAYIMAELRITPEIQRLIDRALELDPNEGNVLQLLAADAEEREDYDSAIAYWRRLAQLNPDSGTARDSIAELQRRRDGGTEAESAGPELLVAVSIADGLSLDPGLRVFVAARNALAEGAPPLAVASLTVADLPVRVRLYDGLAVGPFNLSSAESVFISALISFSGSANRTSGDLFAESPAFSPADPPQPLELTISEIVP